MQWFQTHVSRSLRWWERYERRLMLVGLITGFVFDLIIADRPDSTTNNLFLLSYLAIAGTLIILLNLRTARHADRQQEYQPLILLLILQFCFGGLASNLLVLYGRSGTFAGSTLFFIILGGMLIGNEFMKTRYSQLRFNIVVYYTLLLTYLLIAVPTFLFHSVGTLVFLTTGLISLGLISIFLWAVYWLVLRGREREHQLYEVSFLVFFVFALFTGLYFMRIIPPVPLSLKDIGMYHTLQKTSAPTAAALYSVTYEPSPWYALWRDTSARYTIASASAPAVCFSSVFAPTGLTAPIFHRWQKYDEVKGEWVQVSRTSFGISGGREGGFRGYTSLAVSPGKWRCDVETANGALIGRESFKVIQNGASQLSTKTL